MREVVQKLLGIFGYRITKKSAGHGANAYHVGILALLSSKSRIKIVVVGANDGQINDPLYGLIKTKISAQVDLVLVEPQPALLPILRENYGFVQSVKIHEGVVGPEGIDTLFTVKKQFWDSVRAPYAENWPSYRAPTGIASTSKEHVKDWTSKYLKRYSHEDVIEAVQVSSKPLRLILSQLGDSLTVDVLQVDAEGMDDSVIYNSDLDQTRPSLILFESENLQARKRKKLFAFLREKGYEIFDSGRDSLAILTNTER